MSTLIAFRLRKLPAIYWFESGDYKPEPLDEFIVKTRNGVEKATVLKTQHKQPDNSEKNTDENFILQIVRQVNESDKKKLEEISAKEKDTFCKAKEKVAHHKLEMKLLKAEYLFDYSRLILYFKSENKVDFRELLKTLAATFKTRIELRQIGVRDEAKLLGGIGCCGKEVCCAQFMTSFYPVSTKMAKEQNLSLNPAKLSGICSRLLCCLAHEHEFYASFHGNYPRVGAEVVVGKETARVMDINYIASRLLLGFKDRRKMYFQLEIVKGKKDEVTGRNLWWIDKLEEFGEPDLDLLLVNLNPPGTGKKKKKNSSVNTNNNESSDEDCNSSKK